MSQKIENTPQKIYLQIGDEEINDFNELTEVSWCPDKIYDTDIEYNLSNQHSPVSDEEIERIILNFLNWYYPNPDYNNKLVAKEIFKSISKWLQSTNQHSPVSDEEIEKELERAYPFEINGMKSDKRMQQIRRIAFQRGIKWLQSKGDGWVNAPTTND